MKQLHCSMIICKAETIKSRPSNMRTWHCKHKEMCIRPSYKKCQNTIIHLKTRYVDHAIDAGIDNIIITVQKRTTPANGKFRDLPYYVARIQRHKRYVILRCFDRHFPDHEFIAEIDNPNSIQAFNGFQEERHAEHRYNHFRSMDLTREELYNMGVPTILDDEEE